MNPIIENVESLLDKYDFIDNDTKLVLMYLKEFGGVRWDSKYISTQDLLSIDISLVQQIIDAQHMLRMLEESE